MNPLIIGLILSTLSMFPDKPKFRVGEIFGLAKTERYGVVMDVKWDGRWEYTVVPAEVIFPNGTPR